MSRRNERHAAKLSGRTQYFTGKPCKNGHISERQTRNGVCVTCRRARKAATQAAHPEKTKVALTSWKIKNHARTLAHRRNSYKRNKTKSYQRTLKWRVNNPGTVNAMTAKRRARKFKATPRWANHKAIKALYRACHSIPGYQVDHIVPLCSRIVCGLHCEANLQILPADQNRAKSNRFWPDMPGGENLELFPS